MTRHFLVDDDLTPSEQQAILDSAAAATRVGGGEPHDRVRHMEGTAR